MTTSVVHDIPAVKFLTKLEMGDLVMIKDNICLISFEAKFAIVLGGGREQIGDTYDTDALGKLLAEGAITTCTKSITLSP